MRRFADAVQDPRSPLYRHFLAPAAIGRRFGLPADRLRRLTRQLGAAGIRVTASYPQRTELQVRGTAHAVERLLRVRLGDFRDSHGRRFHRPLAQPRIPAPMHDALVVASGLDNRQVDLRAAVPGVKGLTPATVARAYEIDPLHKMGLQGGGQTVAVFSTGTFKQSEIDAFDSLHGISGAPPVQRVQVGGPVPYVANDVAEEVDLDLEVIRGIAPKAQIMNYETPCCTPASFPPVIDRIVADHRADLVNMSYGYCELILNPPSALLAADRSFQVARMSGITVFVSSGDDGAYECQRNNVKDHRLTVPWPASSPNVVSVGGTLLDVRKDGSYLGEVGWENILTRGGGGGGLSLRFPRPDWQTGAPGVNNSLSNGMRQVPDVAATGDTDSGFDIYTLGTRKMIGGTSASAPLWTGSMVLARELAQREHAGKLGFLGPILYRIGSTSQPHKPFHDVTLGGNRYYQAVKGWDFSTGLGTPRVYNLARDIVEELKHSHG
jgi:kumamolisin